METGGQNAPSGVRRPVLHRFRLQAAMSAFASSGHKAKNTYRRLVPFPDQVRCSKTIYSITSSAHAGQPWQSRQSKRGRPRARIDGEGMPWRRPLKLLLKNYSIISVTRTKNDSGMVKPSAFAVVLLKTRSNLTGCSMGMSAGLTPRKSLTSSRATSSGI